jgi:protein-tyrosine kinase
MGTISDALERHKKEKSIKTQMLIRSKTEDSRIDEQELSRSPMSKIYEGFDPKLIVCEAPESYDAENFKILRAQIIFPKDGKRPKTIMVTSAFPGEGKTFVASNLAASLAQGIDEYVLLIDCDLRRPTVHSMFGYSNREGLREYLTGKRQLSDLFIKTKINKLSLLTAGSLPPNPSELLSSDMMKSFLEEVKGRYEDRFIIIDSPPSQFASDANVLAKRVDGIIFVIMSGKSPRKEIQRGIQNLGKEKIIGIVFNGHSQSYRYYRKYDKEYKYYR